MRSLTEIFVAIKNKAKHLTGSKAIKEPGTQPDDELNENELLLDWWRSIDQDEEYINEVTGDTWPAQ